MNSTNVGSFPSDGTNLRGKHLRSTEELRENIEVARRETLNGLTSLGRAVMYEEDLGLIKAAKLAIEDILGF